MQQSRARVSPKVQIPEELEEICGESRPGPLIRIDRKKLQLLLSPSKRKVPLPSRSKPSTQKAGAKPKSFLPFIKERDRMNRLIESVMRRCTIR